MEKMEGRQPEIPEEEKKIIEEYNLTNTEWLRYRLTGELPERERKPAVSDNLTQEYQEILAEAKVDSGSFSDILPEEIYQPDAKKELEPQVHEDLVKELKTFREAFNPIVQTIYYPCSSVEVSITKVFPDSRVIFVDIDHVAIEALQKSGYEAHEMSVLEFKPDAPVDLLFILNPQISPEKLLETVRDGGYVLCNNYHETATQVRENKNFKLKAVIATKADGSISLDIENFDDHWNEISTDEEFEKAPFSWGAVNYRTAKSIVKQVTGKETNILEEYKKLIAEAKEQDRKKHEEFKKQNPDMADINWDSFEDTVFYNFQDEPIMLNTHFPKKKGTADDIFVFQKIDK